MTARLFSYCIPFDDGAAPNPYWGTCTLVICKPKIRVSADEGDWVAGTGAKFARLGDGSTKDLSGKLVYAMKVTKKMTMADYDGHTKEHLPKKVPDWGASDHRRRVGDSIYDFSRTPPRQRRGVHLAGNMSIDLGGKYALLSTHFYYFGENAIDLPPHLRPIAQNQQGHRVKLNEPYAAPLVAWIDGLGHPPGAVLGDPLLDLFADETCSRWCASSRSEANDMDAEILEPGC